MNHKDERKAFKREINLFERVIARLEGGTIEQVNQSRSVVLSDNEGGNIELNRLEYKTKSLVKSEVVPSESGSDITQKAVSDLPKQQ